MLVFAVSPFDSLVGRMWYLMTWNQRAYSYPKKQPMQTSFSDSSGGTSSSWTAKRQRMKKVDALILFSLILVLVTTSQCGQSFPLTEYILTDIIFYLCKLQSHHRMKFSWNQISNHYVFKCKIKLCSLWGWLFYSWSRQQWYVILWSTSGLTVLL